MAINRAPFNALVDDDGTGTTGTPWNKAQIAGVILDPVDAALAALPAPPPAGPVSLLTGGSGTVSGAGPENIANILLPALTLRDLVVVSVAVVNSSTAAVIVDLRMVQGPTDMGGIVLTGTSGAGDLVPSGIGTYRVDLRRMPPAGANLQALGMGAVTTGTGQARGFPFGALNTADASLPTVNMFFRQMSGIAAGGSLAWAWSVYLFKG